MKKFRLFSYNPPAKGVSKNDERASVQTDFPGFFIMYGRKFWNISNCNLIIGLYMVLFVLGAWKLTFIPVVGIIFYVLFALMFGLLMCGTAYVTRGYVRGDPVYLLSDFFYAVKKNLFQGILLGIIDLLITALLLFDIGYWSGFDRIDFEKIYASMNETEISSDTDASVAQEAVVPDTVPEDDALTEDEPGYVKDMRDTMPAFLLSVCRYGSYALFVIYIVMRFYMYLLLVTFKTSIFKIMKNSFIFAFVGMKRNVFALLGCVALIVINAALCIPPVTPIGIALPLIITTASLIFITTYAAYPVVKKYMITPYYKDEEVSESYDKIFEDRG